MRGFSKAIVAGNLTRDPEMRATPSGAQACNFTIAVNRVFKGNDGNQQEQTSFIDCVAWGRSGETISQYVKKVRRFWCRVGLNKEAGKIKPVVNAVRG